VYYERYAFFSLAGVGLAKLFGLPVILEVNEVTGIERARKQILVALSSWFEKAIFCCADRVVTVSTFLRNQALARGAHPDRVCTIPNGIDPRRFTVQGGGASIRRQYGFEGKTVVGFVGWFDEWDRLDVLIEAVKQVSALHPDVRLMLVGDGPVMDRIQKQASSPAANGCVILTGPVDRALVPAYMEAMDICVLPNSNPYGSPMVLIEFMAMGRAVIAPDLLPIRDVIQDGVNGCIVQRASVAALREEISRLVADPDLRDRLGQAARRDVLTHRTWSTAARRVTALVDEIACEA
jgi:glycosyltransferase involved in cell wall biosynthesis